MITLLRSRRAKVAAVTLPLGRGFQHTPWQDFAIALHFLVRGLDTSFAKQYYDVFPFLPIVLDRSGGLP
jgi:hypothetical protein